MTAEVAILNRAAVTLAADSAVTLTVGGTEKIYNSADKLFELSTDAPMAIMLYNTMSFMEIPFETIIKQFRASKFCKPRDYVQEYSKDFFDYLNVRNQLFR